MRIYEPLHDRTVLRVAVMLVLVLAGPCWAWAQSGRLLPEGDGAYVYIERLQRRGHLLDLNPTRQPYAEGDIARALARLDTTALGPMEARWVSRLRQTLTPASAPDEGAYRLGLRGGVDATNGDRLDPLRPLGEDLSVFPRGTGEFLIAHGPWVGNMGLRFDTYYDLDPDGLDAVNRLMMRSEETYLGYQGRWAQVHLGRVPTHWSLHGATAALISTNPRTYDAVHLRLGGRRLSVSSLLGELDSITLDGRFTGTAGADSVAGSENRYVTAHRIDWRPRRWIQLTFMEAALYSGAEAGLSLKYLNPLNPFFLAVDNRPKNEENNGLVGGQLWLHRAPFTVQGQLVLDDLDILNGGEPASFAFTGTLLVAGVRPWADVGLSVDAIAARTFNAEQIEGQYHFLQRGLATQFSDYVHARVFADLYLDDLLPGLTVTPTIHLLAQGEGDLRQSYPDNSVETILAGTVERTVRLAADVRYQSDPRWWLKLNAGINWIDNVGNQVEVQDTRGVVHLAFGFRLFHAGRLNQDGS